MLVSVVEHNSFAVIHEVVDPADNNSGAVGDWEA